MDGIGIGVLAGLVAGVIGGIAGPFLLLLILPRKSCPECSAFLPRLRNCWDGSGAMRRCPECGCGVDAKGRVVDD